MTDFERLAYALGYAANQSGVEADANPYDEPEPATAWAKGWWDAEQGKRLDQMRDDD
jgi:ribosome modulation factor